MLDNSPAINKHLLSVNQICLLIVSDASDILGSTIIHDMNSLALSLHKKADVILRTN